MRVRGVDRLLLRVSDRLRVVGIDPMQALQTPFGQPLYRDCIRRHTLVKSPASFATMTSFLEVLFGESDAGALAIVKGCFSRNFPP